MTSRIIKRHRAKARRDFHVWAIFYPLCALFALTLLAELYLLAGIAHIVGQ